MDRPRLFLSTVSEELRTARQAVARTLRTLGFDPVSQDDFPTGYGELRQWLREQLDSCEGLIQLVGDGYGAEPPDIDPEYGRVSYTQLEFLYAHKQKKKTWIIVIGKDFPRDKPPDQLDLPRDPGHPDPIDFQAERRTLQQHYLAQLKQENHLRHTANTPTELDNIVLRLRDELSALRERAEQGARRLTRLVMASLFGLTVLGGGGWWGYQQLQHGVQEVGVVNEEKIRAHLQQATEETHRRELAEAEAATDWKTRQRLREAADEAHRVRLSRIGELAISFAEIEGKSQATSVFQEMTRILTEQGVDEAIVYMGTQQAAIFNTVRTRAEAAREHNRADLQPLLQTAGLHGAKGQAKEARALYNDILALEPDWPDALHRYFWFLADQGDLARVRTTLVDARREYDEAHRLAQRLMDKDPSNTEWQRDLSVSHDRIGDVLVAQGDLPAALTVFRASLGIAETLAKRDAGNSQWQRDLYVSYWRLADMAEKRNAVKEAGAYWKQAYEVLSRIDKRGLHLTPDDRKFLAALREKIRAGAQ
ncbi:MAG: DUF4062 domain-containing protein [Nitrospira sp.]|nr:MAG: DUF4062 domain-containing protein [Nitrospira sp.]